MAAHLYAVLCCTLQCTLIHPSHVLLVVCIKILFLTHVAPQDEMCILYAVGGAPASTSHLLTSWPCCEGSTNLLYCFSSSATAASCWMDPGIMAHAHFRHNHLTQYPTVRQASLHAYLGVSASVQSGNFVCGGNSHSVHSKQGVKPGRITRACPRKPSVPPSTKGLMVSC